MKKEIYNTEININEWEFYQEDYPEITRYEDRIDFLSDSKQLEYNDLMTNFNIQLDNPILIIGNLELYYGQKNYCSLINSKNIKDIFKSCINYDCASWEYSNYNVYSKQQHHDGVNYYEYREVKNMSNIDIFINKIQSGEKITRSMINYYTKSLQPYIIDVYGA